MYTVMRCMLFLFCSVAFLPSCTKYNEENCSQSEDSLCDLEAKYENLREQARILKRRARHAFSKDIINYRRLLRQAADKEAAAEQLLCRIEQLRNVSYSE